MPRLQQLALAQAGVAAHEDMDVAAHGHSVLGAHKLAHSAQQGQDQACLIVTDCQGQFSSFYFPNMLLERS